MRKLLPFLTVLTMVALVGAILTNGVSAAQKADAKDRKVISMVDPGSSKLFGNGSADTQILVFIDQDGATLAVAEIPGLTKDPGNKHRDAVVASFEALYGRTPVYRPTQDGTAYCTRGPNPDCKCLDQPTDCSAVPVRP